MCFSHVLFMQPRLLQRFYMQQQLRHSTRLGPVEHAVRVFVSYGVVAVYTAIGARFFLGYPQK